MYFIIHMLNFANELYCHCENIRFISFYLFVFERRFGMSNRKLLLTAVCLATLFGMSGFSSLLVTNSQASNFSVGSAASCQTEVAGTYATLDKETAISNAINSQQFAQTSSNYENATYNSIFQIDKTMSPYPTCSEKVLSFNVVFTLFNSTGKFAGDLVITESQNFVVMGSSLQTNGYNFTNYNYIWAGYEATVSTSSPPPIYQAYTYWTEPTPTYPSTGCGSYGYCNVATWVGLESQQGGNSNGGLVQDGTSAICVASGTSCSDQYFAWYQILSPSWNGGNAVECTSTTGGSVSVSGSDSIYAAVTNEAATGGSNSLYDFYVDDSTSGTSCYMGGESDTSMTSPTWAAYIVENFDMTVNGVDPYAPLAAFTTVPFSYATYLYGGSYYSINSYLTYSEDMHNGINYVLYCGSFVTNVSYGTLSSSGDFTMTYSSSQYTPEYKTGC